MKRNAISIPRWALRFVPVLLLSVAACGGSSGDGTVPSTLASGGNLLPAAARTVEGTVVPGTAPSGVSASLDADPRPVAMDRFGHFALSDLPDGDHTLFVRTPEGATVPMSFRMLSGQGLALGTVTTQGNRVMGMTGFDGYRFGFVDADGDGMNDLFADADGDGICDAGKPYAGRPYLLAWGYRDADGDGKNDLFRDANGDGVNDLASAGSAPGFGCVDANGDGIDDRTGMPFRHPFGHADRDGNGVNDLFADADGDGVNDLTGVPYVALPGWVDLDGDGVCDFFRDANGDGINDVTGTPYAHGFGWADANGDGVNDLFVDADGDGINDLTAGRYARLSCGYGFTGPRTDANGDGIDDVTGMPWGQGFGWVDANGDGINDAFADANADGINDRTGRSYTMGFGRMGAEATVQGTMGWPMQPMGGGGPMMGGGMRR